MKECKEGINKRNVSPLLIEVSFEVDKNDDEALSSNQCFFQTETWLKLLNSIARNTAEFALSESFVISESGGAEARR